MFETPATPPRWRTVGTVTVADNTRFAAGDPCYGPPTVMDGVRLPAGTYQWQVRDANDNGERAFANYEVRLINPDAPGIVDDWNWWNAYGDQNTNYLPNGIGDTLPTHSRGVDAGTMCFYLYGPNDTRMQDDDEEYGFWNTVLESLSDGIPHENGRLLSLTSGWGDGGYPLAARSVNGSVVEVRMQFVGPDPEPLGTWEFELLLPGVFADVRDLRDYAAYMEAAIADPANASLSWDDLRVTAPEPGPLTAHGRVGLVINRSEYTRTSKRPDADDYDPTDTRTSVYNDVCEVLLPDTGYAYTNSYNEEKNDWHADMYLTNNYRVIEQIAHLWRTLTPATQAELTASETVLDSEDMEPSGTLVAGRESIVLVWLTVTLPTPALL